jgi:hypothetical protein
MQPFSSERKPKTVFPTELMTSYASFIAAYIARGANHDFMQRVYLFSMNFRRSVRVLAKHSSDVKSNVAYYLPFSTILTPISLGGGGQMMHTVIGANKDMNIAYECNRDPKLLRIVNAACYIMKVPKPDIANELGRQAASKRRDGSYVGPFAHGMKYLDDQLIPSRVLAAKQASAQLASWGIRSPSRLYYPDTGKTLIEDSVASSPHSVILNTLAQTKMGLIYLNRAQNLDTGVDSVNETFGWTAEVRLYEQSVLENWHDHVVTPLECLDPKMRNIALKYGVGAHQSAYAMSPTTVLSELRKDKYFPRHIRPEQIFTFLTDPAIMANEQRIMTGLIMMGATPGIAGSIARKFRDNQQAFMFRQSAMAFSMNDQFIPMLALDFENHKRVVQMGPVPRRDFQFMLMEFSFMQSILNSCKDGVPRSYLLDGSNALYAKMEEHFLGRLANTAVLRYSNEIFRMVHDLFSDRQSNF